MTSSSPPPFPLSLSPSHSLKRIHTYTHTELLRKFTPKLLKKDFMSFRQFHSKYNGKNLSNVSV